MRISENKNEVNKVVTESLSKYYKGFENELEGVDAFIQYKNLKEVDLTEFIVKLKTSKEILSLSKDINSIVEKSLLKGDISIVFTFEDNISWPAFWNPLSREIWIDARQELGAFTYCILFEFTNAINHEVSSKRYHDYDDADSYAHSIESSEFLTKKNVVSTLKNLFKQHEEKIKELVVLSGHDVCQINELAKKYSDMPLPTLESYLKNVKLDGHYQKYVDYWNKFDEQRKKMDELADKLNDNYNNYYKIMEESRRELGENFNSIIKSLNDTHKIKKRKKE